MMKLPAALRGRLAETTGNDAGFTLLELVVVMLIMTIVMIIFTAGVTQAYSAENKVDTASRGQGQLVIAFQRLDKEVRYAAGISTPATVANAKTGATDPVVEWLSSFTGTSICTEVRLNTGISQLQQRTWTSGTPTFAPSSWQILAEGVSATTPFTTLQPASIFQFQRLEIAVTSIYGVNANKTAKTSDITFTALNTTSSTTAATAGGTCTEGRGLQW